MSSKKPSFDDMKTDEMRKHLFQYNEIVKQEAELKGIRTMKRTPLLDNMKRKFQIIKDTKGFYASPREKKVLEVILGNQRKFFKDNRPEKFRKKEVKKEVKKEEPKKKEVKKEAPKKKEVKKEAPKKKEEPKKSIKDQVKKIMSELTEIEAKVFDKKYDMKNLKKKNKK